jgi:hypothetical protein
MPNLNIPVDQHLLDALSDYAHSQRMSKAAVVRAWLAGLANTGEVAAIQSVQALSAAEPVKRVGFVTADPVAKRQPNPEFQAALQAQLAQLKAQS